MKTTLTTLFAVIMFFAFMATSLRAQTNQVSEAVIGSSNEVSLSTKQADKQSLEIETRKIEAEKDRLSQELDFGRSVIHYTAAYSWIILILAFFYFRFRRRKLMHETLRLMVEKGAPINPELVESIKNIRGQRRLGGDFRTGLILVAVGTGVTIMAGKAGLIILIIGAAFLILGFLEGFLSKKDKNGQSPKL